MPRPFAFKRKAARPAAPAPRPPSSSGAPGDGVLEAPALALGQAFSFDAAFAARLRLREINPSEAFTVKDPSGAFYRASLGELGPAGGTATPYELCGESPEASVELTLACAVLARQRMIFVAQKATELGVSRLVPLLTDYSVPESGLAHEKAHAWPGQLVRAAKQCRRSSLPELLPPMSLDAFLGSAAFSQADLALCLDNVGTKTLPSAPGPKRIVLLTGPEGGFSEAERKRLAGRCVFRRLGGRVLRAETAVMVGLAAVHCHWGDFRA